MKNMMICFREGNDMEELIKRLERVIEIGTPDKAGMHPISAEAVLEVVKQLQTAQPEIIRCCECKYLQCNMRPDGYLPKGVDEFECRHWCGSCDPMDFCSRAERREVDNERKT